MLGLHTDDFTVHHPKGVATGHDQMKCLLEPTIRLQLACVASI